MTTNDRYAPFRSKLSAEQRQQIENSEKPVQEYGRIAVEEAKKQLALLKDADGKPVILPDDPGICLRFPGIDPKGEYSVIDMRFKKRYSATANDFYAVPQSRRRADARPAHDAAPESKPLHRWRDRTICRRTLHHQGKLKNQSKRTETSAKTKRYVQKKRPLRRKTGEVVRRL